MKTNFALCCSEGKGYTWNDGHKLPWDLGKSGSYFLQAVRHRDSAERMRACQVACIFERHLLILDGRVPSSVVLFWATLRLTACLPLSFSFKFRLKLSSESILNSFINETRTLTGDPDFSGNSCTPGLQDAHVSGIISTPCKCPPASHDLAVTWVFYLKKKLNEAIHQPSV